MQSNSIVLGPYACAMHSLDITLSTTNEALPLTVGRNDVIIVGLPHICSCLDVCRNCEYPRTCTIVVAYASTTSVLIYISVIASVYLLSVNTIVSHLPRFGNNHLYAKAYLHMLCAS